MVKLRRLPLGVLIAASALWLQGCGAGAEKYGNAPADSAQRTAIGSILSDPQAYLGKEAVLEGKIISQCPSGCFFIMRDNTGQIYVELKGTSFSPLRQCSGSVVAAKGIIRQSSGGEREIQLFAEGLVIKPGNTKLKGAKELQCGSS